MQQPQGLPSSAVGQVLKNLKTTMPIETCKVLRLLEMSKDPFKSPHLSSYLSRCLFKYAQLVRSIKPRRFRFARSRDVFYKFKQARTWEQIYQAFLAVSGGDDSVREPFPKEGYIDDTDDKLIFNKRRQSQDREPVKKQKVHHEEEAEGGGEGACLVEELSSIQEQFEEVMLTRVFADDEEQTVSEEMLAELHHIASEGSTSAYSSLLDAVFAAVQETSVSRVANLTLWTLMLLGPKLPRMPEADRNSVFAWEQKCF